MRTRLVQLIFVVGAILAIVSFNAGATSNMYGPVEPGVYDVFFYAAFGNLHIRIASTDDRNLSLYFMVFEEGLRALEENSLDNVTWLLAQENFNSYEVMLQVPQPGWYAILVSSADTNSGAVGYHMATQRVVPHLRVLVLGASMMILAAASQWKAIVQRVRRQGS